MRARLKKIAIACLRRWHRFDFLVLLPLLGTLPLWLGYPLARCRGYINAWLSKDWRSMAIGFRHTHHQTLAAYRLIAPNATELQLNTWRTQRYLAEAQDEFDGRLLDQHRLDELRCGITPPNWREISATHGGGLLMLTPHYESFVMGIAFLAQAGHKVNAMSSAVTQDPRVDLSVQAHFDKKYRGLEHYLNGGRVLDMELGMRPFYAMLESGQTLVMLADAPVLPNGAATEVTFLGRPRLIAGGALRLASKTNSAIGGFICESSSAGHYQMQVHSPTPHPDAAALNAIYHFFSEAIYRNPGGWWAADLLHHMQPNAQ
jgi:hypothetical protein